LKKGGRRLKRGGEEKEYEKSLVCPEQLGGWKRRGYGEKKKGPLEEGKNSSTAK